MTTFPFERLQTDIAKLIAKTPAGTRLLNEPELSKQLGVSRTTLREAMRTFEAQGLIRRRQGSGTYVIGKVPVMDSGLEELESIDKMASRLGLNISISDLEISELGATEDEANVLGIQRGAKVTRVQRVIREDKLTIAFLVDVLPAEFLKSADLPDSFRGSVLDFLLERGDALTVSRAAISAVVATAEVAKPLYIQRNDVLLKFTSHLYHKNGQIVDYSLSYFIPGFFNFHVVRKVSGG